mgnify:FL=1
MFPSIDSCGEPKPGWTMSTGTGTEARDAMIALAKLVADGMANLGIEKDGWD